MPKVCVDQEKCIACGSCYTTYPEVFEEGADGKSKVKDNNFAAHGYKKEEIIEVCPSDAISVED